MKNDFKRNLQIGFGLSLFLLIISSTASYISIKNFTSTAELVNHTEKVIQETQNILTNMKDAETGQRGYLITHNTEFLEPYNGAYGRVRAAIDNFKQLTLDNPAQQINANKVNSIVSKRFKIMQQTIDDEKANKAPDFSKLREGKESMDEMQILVKNMQDNERRLLTERTDKMNRLSFFTPMLIVIAALLSIVITVFFYKRVSDDYEEKTLLNNELNKKEKEIYDRITIIENIAQNISNGDFSLRLNASEKDNLGSLAGSLNKMAASLQCSFDTISENEWLEKGIARLNERMVGEQGLDELCYDVIDFICTYTNSQIGILYMLQDNMLIYRNSYGFRPEPEKETLKSGEGLLWQSISSKKEILLQNVNEDLYINTGAINIRPKSILAFPIYFERRIIGAIELGSLDDFSGTDIDFLHRSSENIGIALNTALNRLRLKELLEETQAQAEELQSQHSEMENLNTELEAQAEKLQTSEEELKVQQEELQETNQELEERSRLLEEKNHLIVIRNLEIQKKAEELALNARYKSEFLANMSHELRTPLNSILLLSRLLVENSDQNLLSDQVEYARVIQSSGKGLLQLIDEILDLSKIESGKMELEYEHISLEEITNTLKMLFQPLAREKNVDFIVNISKELPAHIESDRMRVDQILKNLISNSLKFTHAGHITLSLQPSQQGGYIDFTVEDTGIGIAKEKQQLVFEAFQQADGSTKRKYGGTGLGLSISRQLAILLSGDISLESEPGKGSTFTLSIPMNKNVAAVKSAAGQDILSTDEEVADMDEYYEPETERQTATLLNYTTSVIPEEIPDDRGGITTLDKAILIVEDDTAFAKILLDFTRQKGYKGIVTVRGDEAIELARTFKPIGILLDIQLPVKDGLQVIDELKKDIHTRHIPVHMLSSFEQKKESLMRGAVDFITKPVDYEKMGHIFEKLEYVIKKDAKKVIIVEDNAKHAKALSYFLSTYDVNSEISTDISGSMQALKKKEIDCVILDMGIPDSKAYETLDAVKRNADLDNVPVIIFTGKSLSKSEESRIRQYADSIVVKTAHSYQRILDEVSLFLHLMEEQKHSARISKKLGSLDDVLKNKKVLVADDDVRNIFSLTKALEKHKMQTISAMDGKEALQALQENADIDIILMDIMMPEMDGFETITQIRKNGSWKKIPIIAVTAKAMMGDREKCIQVGASDYISKPVDTDQLISLLRIWLYEK
ncbi:response regulator [Danxiaibacter flavus]|uniref:histidine kinase n=1 Tax=Danxiaibacter flavus TaxID=3049108 RepID=A0ABV3ZKA6_9BACT|nr:response regulator [Chitinophagaceae bacterium DXS]